MITCSKIETLYNDIGRSNTSERFNIIYDKEDDILTATPKLLTKNSYLIYRSYSVDYVCNSIYRIKEVTYSRKNGVDINLIYTSTSSSAIINKLKLLSHNPNDKQKDIVTINNLIEYDDRFIKFRQLTDKPCKIRVIYPNGLNTFILFNFYSLGPFNMQSEIKLFVKCPNGYNEYELYYTNRTLSTDECILYKGKSMKNCIDKFFETILMEGE